MKVLAVEDDPVARTLLEASLKALGHAVVAASDGESAWSALRDPELRVVVSDWRMPGLDGLELCRRIRANQSEYVGFILLTQNAPSDDNIEAAYAAGVDEFLTKPIQPRELRMRFHVIERILRFTSTVRRLESFLPICSHCRKVRDDKNYWTRIESYIGERTGTTFSHSICPDCYDAVVVPQLRELGVESPKYSNGEDRPRRSGPESS